MPMRSLFTSIGLLLLRVAMGGLMLVHGLPKLSAFGEMKDKFADPLGIGSQLSLIGAVGAEVGCSILLILGLGTRLATIPLAFTMIIAHFVVHANDPWKVKELSAVFLCVYVAMLFTGPGSLSLDQLIWKRFSGERLRENAGDP